MKLDIFDQSAAFDELVSLFKLQQFEPEQVNLTVSNKAQLKAKARVAKWITSKNAWQVTKSVTGVGQIVFCLKNEENANKAIYWLDNEADLSWITVKDELNEFTRKIKQRFS